MGLSLEMLLITSAVGALQSFFFGLYLFTVRKGRSIANLFLALLLIAFALRVTKSVGYYFAKGHVIPDLLMNVGFGCNLAILPLLWLYLRAFLRKDYRFTWKDSVHMIPAVVALALSPVLTDRFWLGQYAYAISLISMLAYLPFCIGLVAKSFGSLSNAQKVWTIGLLMGVTTIWFSYLFNFVFGWVPYITGPVLFSLIVYILSFVALKQSSLFIGEYKYRGSTHSAAQLDACFAEVQRLFASRSLFRDPSLTLPKVAGEVGL